MKIISLKSLFIVVFLCGLVVMIFNGCKPEKTEITAIITVKYQVDTNVIVPFADVVIGKDYQDIKVTGRTDATGEFTATFKLEAILEVIATKDTNTGTGPQEDLLKGVAVIRLKPGEVAYKTVFIR
jgi:hypothetical protein